MWPIVCNPLICFIGSLSHYAPGEIQRSNFCKFLFVHTLIREEMNFMGIFFSNDLMWHTYQYEFVINCHKSLIENLPSISHMVRDSFRLSVGDFNDLNFMLRIREWVKVSMGVLQGKFGRTWLHIGCGSVYSSCGFSSTTVTAADWLTLKCSKFSLNRFKAGSSKVVFKADSSINFKAGSSINLLKIFPSTFSSRSFCPSLAPLVHKFDDCWAL